MTQELVIVVILSGLIGLLWLMTLAIWEGRQSNSQAREAAPSGHSDDVQPHQRALERALKQMFAA
jgi:divalent metal cation (Fe/Co/Zn/Cd) transporter